MPRYYSDDLGKFIDVEVVWSGRDFDDLYTEAHLQYARSLGIRVDSALTEYADHAPGQKTRKPKGSVLRAKHQRAA